MARVETGQGGRVAAAGQPTPRPLLLRLHAHAHAHVPLLRPCAREAALTHAWREVRPERSAGGSQILRAHYMHQARGVAVLLKLSDFTLITKSSQLGLELVLFCFN